MLCYVIIYDTIIFFLTLNFSVYLIKIYYLVLHKQHFNNGEVSIYPLHVRNKTG